MNLYIYLFLSTIIGPIYYGPPQYHSVRENKGPVSLKSREQKVHYTSGQRGHRSDRFFSWESQGAFRNPLRTAVPFWGQSTRILSGSSPDRDCGSKRVEKEHDANPRTPYPWTLPEMQLSTSNEHAVKSVENPHRGAWVRSFSSDRFLSRNGK